MRVLYSHVMSKDDTHAWIETARQRGLSGPVRLTLTVLEPLGVLGAQILYAAIPLSTIFGAQHAVNDIARALEEPDGIRQILDALDSADTHR